jgi:hypothetical protein
MSGSATQVSHQCSFRTCRVLLLRDDIYWICLHGHLFLILCQ